MAKSTRSKVKRAFRAKKRTNGVYAAAEAARLQRLNAKIVALRAKSPSTEEVSGDEGEGNQEGDVVMQGDGTTTSTSKTFVELGQTATGMDVDGASSSTAPKVISTHGPRNSGREEWRKSKGMGPRARAQKNLFTARKPGAGRPHRRR